MLYDIDFEACALLFLIAGSIEFFRKKRFPNLQNRLFSWILIITIVGIVTNITLPRILYIESLPSFIPHIFITLFYSFQTIFPLLILFYVISMTEKRSTLNKKRILMLSTPFLITLVLLIISGFTNWIYIIVPGKGFIHGNLHFILPLVVCSYMAAAIGNIILHRQEIGTENVKVISLSVIVIIISFVVQSFMPGRFLVGAFVVLAITILFFNIQRPYEMIDVGTGLLNNSAFNIIARDYIAEKRTFQVLCIDLREAKRNNRSLDNKQLFGLNKSVSEFFTQIAQKNTVFSLSEYRFGIITQLSHINNAPRTLKIQ